MKSFRILSTDPGLTNCGIAILEIYENEIKVLHAETFNTDESIKSLKYISSIHGERQSRLIAISEKIKEIASTYKPQLAGSEIPFYNKLRPSAFEALVMAVTIISNTIFKYNQSIKFFKIPAAKVKSNLKVSGGSGDKSLIKDAIRLRNLSYESINLEELGPDATDAIAVGLYIYDTLKNS